MQRMIEKFGGVARVSPSMREVPIESNRDAIDFAHQVMTGEISTVILMTGVGFRYLIQSIQKHVDTQRFLDCLGDGTTICRGPKPVAAMREFGLNPTFRVGEPNTWRELLQTIDAGVPIANQLIGLQEYGITNASLIAGLEARGANVRPLRVYAWDFPEDDQPFRDNIQALAGGQCDMLLLTSAHQVVNLFRLAESMNQVDALRSGLEQTLIASIGPTTTSMLEEMDVRVDMEPSHPKMGHLVSEAATRGVDALRQRRLIRTHSPNDKKPLPEHPAENSLFMRAARGEATERTPIWLMRQAGRYMSEYREVRSKQSFLELCQTPHLCAEVMQTAVEKLDVDAAIIFSDILPILIPMGLDLDYVKGDGPKISNPIRDADQVSRLKLLKHPEQLDYVYETVRLTREAIDDHIPIIGFSGAPFTLASYAIEGGSSRNYLHTKMLMHGHPDAWQRMMETLAASITIYLNHQIAAGAQCVQLFDSWAGCLSPGDYAKFVLPHMKQILSGITSDVPVINFATGNPELLTLLRGDRRTIVGVDWRIGLDAAWQRVGHDKSVQGNLDPTLLLSDLKTMFTAVDRILESVDGRPGHLFNLGHGVHKETPVDHAVELVRYVKQASRRKVDS
ncbi:MAG: uroporphyrinogen decarboxylase [Planctomycetota bacterium]